MQSAPPTPQTLAAALRRHQLVDITTTGRRTGRRIRIEIDSHWVDNTVVISGMPGRRDWYANLIADGRFTFHLKQPFAADLVAVATPVTDPEERRRLLEPITRTWGASARIEAFVARSPLVVVAFPDLAAAA